MHILELEKLKNGIVNMEIVIVTDKLEESIDLLQTTGYLLLNKVPVFEVVFRYENEVPIIKIKKVLSPAESLEVEEKIRE